MTTITGTSRHDETITVSVGDVVGFKDDIEQSGTVVAIEKRRYTIVLVIENGWGFSGEYLQGETIARKDLCDCWLERAMNYDN